MGMIYQKSKIARKIIPTIFWSCENSRAKCVMHLPNGKSTLHNIEQIDRGYQNIDQRLIALGANIKRVDGN